MSAGSLRSSTAATLSLAVGTTAKNTASATVAQIKRRRRHGDRVATPQRESSPTPRPTPTTSTTQSCPKPVQHNHNHVKRRPRLRGTSRRKPHGKPQASACTQPPAVHKLCVSLQFRQATEAEGSTGQARPADKPDAAPYKTANCEEWRTFPAFFLVFVSSGRRRMASRFYPTPCEMNVKRGLKPTAEKTKNQRKT